MAPTVAELPSGPRISDFISLGVLTQAFPSAAIGAVLSKTGKASVRKRDLPAQVVVYYVLGLGVVHALFLRGGAALPAGRDSVDARSGSQGAGGGQIGHLAGAPGWVRSRCGSCTMSWSKPVAVAGTRWGGAAQTGHMERYSPLGGGGTFIGPCSRKSSPNASSPAATAAIPTASSVR